MTIGIPYVILYLEIRRDSMYIIYDLNKRVYRDFIGEDKSKLWLEFVKYMSERGNHETGFTVVEITEQEHRLIKEWFKEEYLMVSVDSFIIDRLKGRDWDRLNKGNGER